MLEAFGGTSPLNAKVILRSIFSAFLALALALGMPKWGSKIFWKLKGKLPGCILEMRCIMYLMFIVGSFKSHPAPKYGCGVGLELRVTLGQCLAGALCLYVVDSKLTYITGPMLPSQLKLLGLCHGLL